MSPSVDANLDSTDDNNRRRHTRQIIRVILLVIAVLLLLPLPNGTRLLVVVPALSPLIGFASLLSTRTFQLATVIGLLVTVAVLIRRRWFCRWVCPTGTCADFAGKLGIRLHRKCPHLPPIGQWIALLTLGGAVLGYPLLLWLDPLAIFSGLPGIMYIKTIPAIGWSVIGILSILALSIAWPGLWCGRLCPLGAFQDLLSRLKHMVSGIRRSKQNRVDSGLPRRAVLGAVMGISLAAIMQRVRASISRPLRPAPSMRIALQDFAFAAETACGRVPPTSSGQTKGSMGSQVC